MAKNPEQVSFSTREMEVLALAWQCFDSEPKINMKKLAELTGYTEGSASVTIGKIKRKLKQAAAGSDGTPASTPKKPTASKTPKSGGKRGASAPANNESPSKKKKGGARRTPYEDDDEEFGNYKIKSEEPNDLLQGASDFLAHSSMFENGYSGFQEMEGNGH